MDAHRFSEDRVACRVTPSYQPASKIAALRREMESL
jgi:hypothetical protein